MKLLVSGEGRTQTGVLTPLPCPHTLPMLLDEVGARLVPYHLREDKGWALDLEELQLALTTARGSCQPRAVYISNPGNPTGAVYLASGHTQFISDLSHCAVIKSHSFLFVLLGHVQDRKSIEDVIRFAAAERLFLLVDEVIIDYCV